MRSLGESTNETSHMDEIGGNSDSINHKPDVPPKPSHPDVPPKPIRPQIPLKQHNGPLLSPKHEEILGPTLGHIPDASSMNSTPSASPITTPISSPERPPIPMKRPGPRGPALPSTRPGKPPGMAPPPKSGQSGPPSDLPPRPPHKLISAFQDSKHSNLDEVTYNRVLAQLQNQIQDAVKNEDFEKCATLRDQKKQLEQYHQCTDETVKLQTWQNIQRIVTSLSS